jgi:nucleotide-binding universal stress UspA family protein
LTFFFLNSTEYLQLVYTFIDHNGSSDGGAAMWNRLLLAIDQFESGQTALKFTAGLAVSTGAEVQVMHVRELSRAARVLPLETPAEADSVVDEAVFSLRMVGVGADGRACSFPQDQVPRRIVEESMTWKCDAIVLGTRRLHGVSRLSARGVREHVIRLSLLPVVAAPTPVHNGLHSPGRFGSEPLRDHGGVRTSSPGEDS